MTNPPPFHVDYGAGARISARSRARNKQAYAEFEASFEKISAGLRAWQVALNRNQRLIEAFQEVR